MIAKILTAVEDQDAIICSVQYLDDRDPQNLVEVGMKQFRFDFERINQQVRVEIVAYGRRLIEQTVEKERLKAYLRPGTEFPV